MQIEVSKLEFQPPGTKLWQFCGQGGLVGEGAIDVCDVCVEASVALLVPTRTQDVAPRDSTDSLDNGGKKSKIKSSY